MVSVYYVLLNSLERVAKLRVRERERVCLCARVSVCVCVVLVVASLGDPQPPRAACVAVMPRRPP